MERRGGAPVISSGRMDFFCVCVCICIFYFYLYFDLGRCSFYLYSYISIELVFLIALHSVFVLVSMLIEIFLFHICVLQGGCGFKIRILQRARRTDNGVEGGCGEKRKIISYFSQMIPVFPPFDIFFSFFTLRGRKRKKIWLFRLIYTSLRRSAMMLMMILMIDE